MTAGDRINGWSRFLRPKARAGAVPPPVEEAPPVIQPVDASVPRVCIVTPVFNGADYIDETIQSVLSQAGDFVLHYHIQDGGSTDDTLARVEAWMRLRATLPVLCRDIVFTCASEPDAGMYDAINKGFARALPPGDDVVMGWIAADDRLAAGAFAVITAIRTRFPEIRFLGGRISLIDQTGGVIGVHALIAFSQRCMMAGLYDGRTLNFVMQEGTFWCSDLWHKVGGLDTRFRLAGDWDLWRRLAAHASYVSADTILGFHRRRPGQLSEQINRYYVEVDRTLDETVGDEVDPALAVAARGGRVPASLREAYGEIAIEHEVVKRDPPRFRASAHAATVVRYNLDAKLWERTDGYGMVPGAPDVVTPAGTTGSWSVRLVSGFKAAEGPYPEHGLLDMIRWMSGTSAVGEVVLARPGRYRIVLRCRSWTSDQSVTILADGRPLGRLAVTPYEHDRDLLLTVEATLDAGRHELGVVLDQPPEDPRYLLVIAWRAEQLMTEDHAAVLPAPSRPIGLASRGAVPPQAAWPRISLVVPTREHGHFIRDTLNSIVRQGYPDLELIVVDGGSTDQTRRILHEFAGHIAHLVSEPDRGQSDAINKGFRAASGDVLGWLNSDDLLADGALHAIGHAFLFGDSDIVAGACDVFDDRGVVTHSHLPCLAEGPLPLDEVLDLPSRWLRGQFFHQPEVFFSRDIWERAGGTVDEALFFSMDYDLWARMARQGATIRTIGAVIARYRLHAAQKTSTPEAYLPELTAHSARLRERWGLGPPPEQGELVTRLRVVLFNDGGFRYGAGIAHRRLAEALAALGHDVVVLAYADFLRGTVEGGPDPDAVADAILGERPDLVLVGNLHLIAAEFDLPGALIARDIPTIFYAHDQWIATGRCAYPGDCDRFRSRCNADCPTAGLYPALPPERVAPAYVRKRSTAAAAARGRFAIVTNSRYMQRTLTDAFAAGARPPVHLGPIGIDTRVFVRGDRWRSRMLLGLPQGAFIVMVAAANLRDERKGFALVLDALALIDDPHGVLLLVMGSTAPLVDLPFDVHATGYIADEALVALHYQAADLFVGPSLEEAFGQTYLEAGACEVPTIAFDVGGVADAVLHGVTGLLMSERSPAAIATAIETLRADLRLRRQLGIQARLHVVNRFSLEASAAALTSILIREPALGLSLSPNVSVAARRQPLPEPRYLVEADGPPVLPPFAWYPQHGLVEERRPGDRPDLPVRFWWAEWPNCVFLIRAEDSGPHTLQFTVRNHIEGQALSISIDGGASQLVMLSSHDPDVVQTLQVGVDLTDGFNRVTVSFAASRAETEGARRNLALFIEEIFMWEGAIRGSEGLADGTVELVQGFGPAEGPYPEHGLPEPIRWALGTRCTLRVFVVEAGRRCWDLGIRNDRPNQSLRIFVNNLPVASLPVDAAPLSTLQLLRFEADMLAGANIVAIEAGQVLESAEDTRPLAFIFSELRGAADEALDWDADEVRWDLSEGFAAPRPMPAGDGMTTIRPVIAAVPTVVVERGRRGPARLLVEALDAPEGQGAFLMVNGRTAGRLTLAEADADGLMRAQADIVLSPGRNRLQFQFTSPAKVDGVGADAFLLLRSLRIERADEGATRLLARPSAQKWRCVEGFSETEAPLPELGLPRPFRWATDGRGIIRFAQPVTDFMLLLHNDLPGQHIEIRLEDGTLLASTSLAADLALLQEVPIVIPGEGECGFRIDARFATEGSDHDSRRRCFILEGIADGAGNPLRQAL